MNILAAQTALRTILLACQISSYLPNGKKNHYGGSYSNNKPIFVTELNGISMAFDSYKEAKEIGGTEPKQINLNPRVLEGFIIEFNLLGEIINKTNYRTVQSYSNIETKTTKKNITIISHSDNYSKCYLSGKQAVSVLRYELQLKCKDFSNMICCTIRDDKPNFTIVPTQHLSNYYYDGTGLNVHEAHSNALRNIKKENG
jgi:hypothetical protein